MVEEKPLFTLTEFLDVLGSGSMLWSSYSLHAALSLLD